jgi:DNA end-binding protein Ku
MARPYWSGQLKISLVSFGIKLFPATNPAGEISFHQIERKTGKRVHHLNVVDENEPVDRSEIVKGYEYSKGKYLAVEPEEIAKLRIATKDTLDLSQFVDLADVPLELYEKPYFVVPQDAKHAAAFAVIRKALEQTGKAGLGEIAFAGREHLVAIAPAADKKLRGLMAYTLRYNNELRKASEYFSEIDDVQIDKKQLGMATELIRQYAAPFNAAEFKDDYEAALQRLIDAKRKNKQLPLEEEKKRPANVINLMDALQRSIRPEHKAKASAISRSKAGGKGPVLVKPAKRKGRVA